ncbi:MAG TPA: PD-(D/E)XK nuclease family protein [Longimicrobiaceae bacterium]|nr:PD-(D/E)XK nuclease family protein [Longimicrobiaceae bacterium]
MTRAFLGWSEPALPRIAAMLVDHYAARGEVRMDIASVVLPGARAGRRLKELLLEAAADRKVRLVPPPVGTIGGLPELLYEPTHPFADQALARTLWVRALVALPAERLALVFPTRPAADDLRGWHRLAATVERLHSTVGAAGVLFDGVMECCDDGLLFSDIERWTVLAEVQALYRAELARFERTDREIARIDALAGDGIEVARDLWVAGVAEMPGIVRRMLEAARGAGTIRILVHAPDDLADDFDELGSVRPDAWLDREIPLQDAQISVCGRPGDQAIEAVHALRSFDGRYAADEIVVAVPDGEVVPYLGQKLAEAAVPYRAAEGTPLERSAPYRLLEAFAEYLSQDRFEACAALARHPDLWNWLEGAGKSIKQPGAGALREADGWLEPLDRYFSDHLPARMSIGELVDGRYTAAVAALGKALDHPKLLGRMAGKRHLADWASEIMDLLLEVYGDLSLNRARPADRHLIEACQRLRDAAAEMYRLPPEVDELCDAATGIHLMLEAVRSSTIPADADRAAVELLGWLELHLDDSPVAIITGFNEPFLPESVNADAFLPNALRSRLGIVDNDRRYARDAYQLTALLQSREHVRVVAGRRTAKGDPLRPSRLMFATRGTALAERVQRFYGDENEAGSSPPTSTVGEPDGSADESQFSLPPEPVLSAEEPIERIPVTAFRQLLEDPYSFALDRILGLEPLDDAARELDALHFGGLAHKALERFGRSPEVDSNDPDRIRARLDELLDELAREQFGKKALPAVRLQVEQLRARLGAFAHWHAAWIRDGWRVVGVECKTPETGVPFDVDGSHIHLSGRIDRIDYHAERDIYAVFDYKTGETARPPEKTHRKGPATNRVWTDLQLPLYRHLLPAVTNRDGSSPVVPGTGGDIQLGYIVLCRDLGEVGHLLADWSEDDFDDADESACEVIRLLRANRFAFDPNRRPRYLDPPMAALLGMGHLASALDEGEESGE